DYRFGGFALELEHLTDQDKSAFSKGYKSLMRAIKDPVDKTQREFSDLLGRLEDKYEVDLSLPQLTLEGMPLMISLGEKGKRQPLREWGAGTRNQTMILIRLFNIQ